MTQIVTNQTNNHESDLANSALPSNSPEVQRGIFGKFAVVATLVASSIVGGAKSSEAGIIPNSAPANNDITWLRNVSGYPDTSFTNAHQTEISDGRGNTNAETTAAVTLPTVPQGQKWEITGLQGVGSEGTTNNVPNGTWEIDVFSSPSAVLSNKGVGDIASEKIGLLGSPGVYDTAVTNTSSHAQLTSYFVQYDPSTLATPILLDEGKTYFIVVNNFGDGEWGFNETSMTNGLGSDYFAGAFDNYGELHKWTDGSGYSTGVEALDIGFTDPASTDTPEPASLAVLSIGSIALLARRRKA